MHRSRVASAFWWILVVSTLALPTLADVASTKPPPLLPVEPFVFCHSRVNSSHCATVFGYHNPNNVSVKVAVDSRWNYFLPRPFDRGQPSQFESSTTSFMAAHALWRCGGAMLPSRMRRLVWTLRTEHPTQWQSRQARASRQAGPCSSELLATTFGVVTDAQK